MNQTENKSSTKSDMLQNGLDMIYLTVCALWDVTPQKKMMDKMKLSEVYRIVKYQSMAAVACYGLEKWLCSSEGMHQEIEAELLTKWKQTRDMAIRKNAMLDLSRESLFAYFEEQGIWYMPLKGSILKDMYPRLGMRQMADNDILIDVTESNVLENVSCEFENGKKYLLVGKSGVGKSTLIKLLLGKEARTSIGAEIMTVQVDGDFDLYRFFME